MNYIAIYVYYHFDKDLNSSFSFLCYIVERFLQNNFSDKAGGFLKLIWTMDRLVEY